MSNINSYNTVPFLHDMIHMQNLNITEKMFYQFSELLLENACSLNAKLIIRDVINEEKIKEECNTINSIRNAFNDKIKTLTHIFDHQDVDTLVKEYAMCKPFEFEIICALPYIPLSFWFNRDPCQVMIPIAALPYCNRKIDFSNLNLKELLKK